MNKSNGRKIDFSLLEEVLKKDISILDLTVPEKRVKTYLDHYLSKRTSWSFQVSEGLTKYLEQKKSGIEVAYGLTRKLSAYLFGKHNSELVSYDYMNALGLALRIEENASNSIQDILNLKSKIETLISTRGFDKSQYLPLLNNSYGELVKVQDSMKKSKQEGVPILDSIVRLASANVVNALTLSGREYREKHIRKFYPDLLK